MSVTTIASRTAYTMPAPVLSFLTPTQADALADIFFRAAQSPSNGIVDPHQHEDAARAFDFALQYLALPSHWRHHVRQAIETAYEVGEDREGVSLRETLAWVRLFMEEEDRTDADLAQDFEMDTRRVRKFRRVVALLRELSADTLAPVE